MRCFLNYIPHDDADLPFVMTNWKQPEAGKSTSRWSSWMNFVKSYGRPIFTFDPPDPLTSIKCSDWAMSDHIMERLGRKHRFSIRKTPPLRIL